MKKFVWVLLLNLSLIGCSAINNVADNLVDSSYPLTDDTAQISPVREYVDEVNRRLQEAGIKNGKVSLDRKGRLALKGEYANESEVDKAFAIAQEMVGVPWVSPVTPSNIVVQSWAKCLGETLGGIISEECKSLLNHNRTLVSDNEAPNPIKNKYALLVGIGHFKFDGYDLEYSVKDARDIYNYLANPNGGNIPLRNIKLLTDEQATRSAIEEALLSIKAKARKDDLVIVYFSSHGANPDKDGNFHIVAYDSILPLKDEPKSEQARIQDRTNLWYSSFRQEKLKEFVQTISAKRLAVILDTCYSGGVYNHFNEGLMQGVDSHLIQLKKEDIAYNTGQSAKYLQENILGAKDIFIENESSSSTPTHGEKNPAYYSSSVDWGRLLISASNEGEKSWEPTEQQERLYNIKNSVFTHYFLQELRNTSGNIKKSFTMAKPETASCVMERGLDKKTKKPITQTPQLVSYRNNANIILGR